MSIENTPVSDETNLDDFSADFFGQNQPAEETTKPPEETEPSEDDALNDDTHLEDDDTLDTETDETEVEGTDAEEAEAPKPKKNRFQERIDEVVGKQREAERRATELERQLTEAIQRLNQQSPEPKPPTAAVKDDAEPQITDTNEDGSEKYPLGEFDAKFLKDYTLYHIQKQNEAHEAQQAERVRERTQQEEYTRRQQAWNEKLEPARERHPDFQEKIETFVSSLSTKIDPAVGNYLSEQIMEMDHGTDVLYYLATHPDEADAIVKSGPKASIRLGALEERIRPKAPEEKTVRTTKAPTPPPTNKGSTGAITPPRGDEDDIDLDAFAKELFKRKR